MSHVFPVKSSAHVHEKPAASSLHVPPFIHGIDAQNRARNTAATIITFM